MTTSTPPPVLQDLTIYEAWDQLVCSNKRCAGATIYLTGRTSQGRPVHELTAAFLTEWSTYAIGPLTCRCGRLAAAIDATGALRIFPGPARPDREW